MQQLVPFDAAAWLATDPATRLPVYPMRIEGVEIQGDRCAELWRREFLVEDVNLFRDLARAEIPAAALGEAVDDPRASPRFRSFVEPIGFGDELRAVLRAGGSPRGVITLWRSPVRRRTRLRLARGTAR